MQTLGEIKALLAARGIRPKHRFGQNFLHDRHQLRKLVDAAAVRAGDVVLEIGPGTGTLTEELLAAEATVVACEIDPDMQAILADRFAEAIGTGRLQLVRGDCLDGKRSLAAEVLSALGDRPFVLVANLPYGAASPVMAILASRAPRCRGQFVTVQREVADRLRAEPGGKDYGPLTVIVRLLCDVRLLDIVRPGSFWPAPEVTSAMIAIEPRHDAEPFASGELDAFERMLHELFSRRRKQLGSILGREGPWPEGVEPTMRPEELSPETLRALSSLRRR